MKPKYSQKEQFIKERAQERESHSIFQFGKQKGKAKIHMMPKKNIVGSISTHVIEKQSSSINSGESLFFDAKEQFEGASVEVVNSARNGAMRTHIPASRADSPRGRAAISNFTAEIL